MRLSPSRQTSCMRATENCSKLASTFDVTDNMRDSYTHFARKPFFLALVAGLMAIGSDYSLAQTAQQRFDLCRSVMDNRPHDPSRDGPHAKPTNSIGYGAYPPPEQQGVWINLKCWEIPGIYKPF